MRRRTLVAASCVLAAALALVCSGDSTRAPNRGAPPPETGRRFVRGPLPEGVVPIRVVLPADPWDLVPQCPSRWPPYYSPYHALWVDKSELSLAGKWAVGFRLEVPPPVVRNLLRGTGLRPATLAAPLSAFSPWAEYAALRIERDWYHADLEDTSRRVQAEAVRRFGETPDFDDPEVAAFRRRVFTETPVQDDAHRALAEAVASGGGMPGSLAIADQFDGMPHLAFGDPVDPALFVEVLTGDGWAEHARHVVASVLCEQPVGLSVAEEAALARRIPAFGDRELAVAAAMFGLELAMARRSEAGIATFRPLLDEALESCREWGEFGDLRGRVVPFDELPAELRPPGFTERARVLGERIADLATVSVDCGRAPCLARLTYLPGTAWKDSMRGIADAKEAWSGYALGEKVIGGDDGPDTAWLAPIPGSWSSHQLRRLGDWRARSGSFECLKDYAMRDLRAQLGQGPLDWEGALATAAYSCHREEPLTDPLGSPGRWESGRWHLGGTSPLLRCIEIRFDGPSPPEGTVIDLGLLVQQVPIRGRAGSP